MDMIITHHPDRSSFETLQDGLTAYVKYESFNGGIDITHTFVPKSLEGRGIAGALVKCAYDFARENDLRVKNTCSYAVAWLIRHPEYETK